MAKVANEAVSSEKEVIKMTDATLTIDQALQKGIAHHRAGQLQDAERFYRAILQAHPTHPDANHNIGVLAVGLSQPEAALPFLKTALEANPAQGQYWLSYIDALIRAGKAVAAGLVLAAGREKGLDGELVRQLEQRLQDEQQAPQSTPSLYAPAIAYREAGRYREASDWLQAWLLEHPQDAEAYALYCHVLLLDQKEEVARSAIEQALRIASQHPAVQLNHARLLLKEKKIETALQVAQSAYQSDEQNPESWLVLAAALGANKKDAQALPLIEKALHSRPDYAEAFSSRAQFKLRANDTAGALIDFEKALAIKPHQANLWDVTAFLRYKSNNLPGAIDALRRALEYDPENVGYMLKLGEYLRHNNQLDAAIELMQQATVAAPDNVGAWANLGTILHATGKLVEARGAYETVLKLKPDLVEVANNLKAITMQEDPWEVALKQFNCALESSPQDTLLLANKGLALLKLRRSPEEVEAVVQEILAINPEDAAAFKLRGSLCKELGRLEEAVEFFGRALKIAPNSADICADLGVLLKDIGRLSEAEVCLRRGLEINPNDHNSLSVLLFILNYTASKSPLQSRQEALRYGELAKRKAGVHYSKWRCNRQPQRLRVGLVSGNLHNHPVGYFLEAVLRQLDPDRLELIAYPTQPKRDALTDSLQQFFSVWEPIYGKSDEEVARQIHGDGVHILLDLSGHTGFNRLPVFAYKPAPVQASWLGYFATTGVNEIDYLIGDPYVTPLREEDHFTETVWRLPESYLCFTPPDVALDVSPLPALSAGRVTFGCFNNLTKMNDAVVALWAKVLHAVPGSQLLLKTKQLADATLCARTRTRFAAHGIGEQRLILEGPSSRAGLLAAYQRVDLALDPFPYPGGTTSAEALWMGVPVLTRRGDRFLSHVGESIAHSAGLPDWIAFGDEDYIAKAIEQTSDLQKLAALRFGLRKQVQGAPLFDAARFSRHLEAALWEMWQKWQQCSVLHEIEQGMEEI